MKNKNNPLALINLRQDAEELVKKSPPKKNLQLFELDMTKLIHELEVHQIELEMQNLELLRAKDEIKATCEKYMELYDFSPLGYFTLSKDGKIMELNLCGAEIIGKERYLLKNKPLQFFISEDTRLIFNLFLEEVFNEESKRSCEVTLITPWNSPIYVQMTGIAIKNKEQCLVTIVDITVRKKTEEQLRESNKILQFNMDRTEIFSLFVVDRELKIKELKEEIRTLEYNKDL